MRRWSRRCARRHARAEGGHAGRINFYTPTFKAYATSELAGCGKSAWPAVSITGGDCKLACDHCKAKILEPMIPARTPDELWRVVNGQIDSGAQGMLLTGGSNQRNEVEYDAFYPTIRRIKDAFPAFKIAMHTALVDADIARRMEDSGIDAAMMDVIGAQDTISQVYHLKRSVADFERSLECLTATSMKVVPHIVIGLHYGRMLGEWNALEIVGAPPARSAGAGGGDAVLCAASAAVRDARYASGRAVSSSMHARRCPTFRCCWAVRVPPAWPRRRSTRTR